MHEVGTLETIYAIPSRAWPEIGRKLGRIDQVDMALRRGDIEIEGFNWRKNKTDSGCHSEGNLDIGRFRHNVGTRKLGRNSTMSFCSRPVCQGKPLIPFLRMKANTRSPIIPS
jgi:hypothetical protein